MSSLAVNDACEARWRAGCRTSALRWTVINAARVSSSIDNHLAMAQSTRSRGATPFSDLSKDPWTLRDPAAAPPPPLPRSISSALELAAEAAALSRGSQSMLGAVHAPVHAPVRAPQNYSELARGPLWAWSPRRLRFERCDACVAQDFDDAWCLFFGAGQRLPVACNTPRARDERRRAAVPRRHLRRRPLSFRAPAPAGALQYWVATLQHLALRAAAPPECYAGGRVDGATRAMQAAWRGALGRRRAARAHAASATLSRVRSRVAVGSALPPPQPLRAPTPPLWQPLGADLVLRQQSSGTSSDAPLPILSEVRRCPPRRRRRRRRRRWRTRAPESRCCCGGRRRKGSR